MTLAAFVPHGQNQKGNTMKRACLVLLCTAAAVLAALAHPASPALADDRVKIAVVTHGQSSDSYWGVVKKGVDDAAKLMDADVSYDAPQTTDMVAMSRMIDAAVTQKVQGLVVSIPDATALETSVKAAADAGIPVIVIDSGEDQVEKLGLKLYVGTTSYFEQGVLAAKKMQAAGVKEAVCANHEPGNLVNESACDGFKKGMDGHADRLEISLDPTDTATRINAYLSAHPDVTGILAIGAPPAANIVAALRQGGVIEKYKIGHFDVSGETLDALTKKEILFSFDSQQYLMGYLPIVMLTLNAKYGVLPTKNIYTGPTPITAADVEKISELAKKGIR
ncbi:rhizopine catabolism ABC transporter substrate-binding protein [Labrys wisconsinensis]|uniref:Simple sugar transport system substrate-binding protein n=1 Tax=Labrys wisconsinensis TaxID=425677 RepID=A0ABU0JKJ9_9HYPH|nr:substrate-binding domain-containing protein [Labrys wisconsinensis]MDQ0474819.1 simple sugar transport system substrate-binding protein [Labrys wisconsinensis]